MDLRIFNFIPATRAEGPGLRACVQVQGCPIHCSGCAVPFSWPPTGGRVVAVSTLAQEVLDGPPVEGITFLGGEPFAQAEALAALGRFLQAGGLSVVTFTGYLLQDLRASRRSDFDALLSVSDLLIDGPFQREALDLKRPWVGSSNQRYHFLTERYRHLEGALESIPNRLEVRISIDGRVQINGLSRASDLRALIS